ncbi:LacI family transcriptional regulator [Paenibacillus yonginensis]|uniref:LacI family transcriptional regulator n=1 Tax=Paenibacillus yonginensis TaxID=1462996 RepID=A0A1B1N066_9BACL|nr:LacI family DNA-binding transcriptional regulator [Paenibacillus yonginensis]ANS74815.1 LacI family transcriptional regulator [Paenibacillus yonginensis]
MATIEDVAKAAGVSKGTVSNVFSKKRPISKEVTEHVMKVAKELNYRPNYWARSLVNKKTRIIGLNMRGEKLKMSHFQYSLLNGVLPVCYERGYRLLLNTLSPNYLNQVEHLASDPVDGEIILDAVIGDSRIEDCLQRNVPIVVIGRPSGEDETRVSYVNNDNISTAAKVTQYLISLGHEQILFINGPENRTVTVDRTAGYMQAFAQQGQSPSEGMIVHQNNMQTMTSLTYSYETALVRLKENPEITAVLTDTESMALGVYKAAAELNLRIPEQLSVLCFGYGGTFAQEFNPPLTGVDLHADKLGTEAILLLLEQLEQSDAGNKLAKRTIIPSDLVVRGSCARQTERLTKKMTK